MAPSDKLRYIGEYKCIKSYINEYSKSKRLYLGDVYDVYFEKGTRSLPSDVYYIYFKNGEHSCNQCIEFMNKYLVKLEEYRLEQINNIL